MVLMTSSQYCTHYAMVIHAGRGSKHEKWIRSCKDCHNQSACWHILASFACLLECSGEHPCPKLSVGLLHLFVLRTPAVYFASGCCEKVEGTTEMDPPEEEDERKGGGGQTCAGALVMQHPRDDGTRWLLLAEGHGGWPRR